MGEMKTRSRSVRHALDGKDALEKERLRHRTGNYFRYEDQRSPIDVAPGCPSHIGARARMTAGPRCEEVNHGERERHKLHKDDVTEVRRERNLYREEARWRSISCQEQGNVNHLD